MPVAGQELGTRSPITVQLGNGFRSFRGMAQDPEPSALGDAQLAYCENVRHRAGMIVDRPGQTKDSLSTPAAGCWEMVFDASDVGAP